MSEVAAVVLAAGRASRYRAAGGAEETKLVADFRGEPLIRWAAHAALASRARPVFVVTGHAKAEVETALAGLDVQLAHNPEYATGLASSLRAGLAALPPETTGAVVLLGDMPEADASVIDALIDRFLSATEACAAIPLFGGKRGNPVLLGRALFRDVARLQGDEGARSLLRDIPTEQIVAVEVANAGVMRDIDTPADLIEAFSVRDAGPQDRAAIVAAIVALQNAERKLSDTRLLGEEVADTYYDLLVEQARADGAMLVAEVGGAFAGFVVGWIEQTDEICETPDSNRFGYISDICVFEPFRGRGAAAVLLRALEGRLAQHGVRRLRLNFLAGNRSAGIAYERAGYAPYQLLYEKRLGTQDGLP
jgi:molybdenum cofactor cytidylyltransferase